ncbi:MAG: tripartite tricarboxylate transporter TctB family protein [Geminicoccaceae bacterium]
MRGEVAGRLLGLVPAALFFVLGVWLYVETFLIGDEFAIGIGMDAGTYPKILAIVTLVLATVMGLRAWFRLDAGEAPEDGDAGAAVSDGERRSGRRKVGLALVALVAYTLLLHPLGFLIATPVLLAVVMLLAGERRPLLIGATAILLTVAVQALSFYGFSIVLPEGPLRLLYS